LLQIYSGPNDSPLTNPATSIIIGNGGSNTYYVGVKRAEGRGAATDYVLSFTNAVPEPTTWAFMLTGFGMVGYSLRRRRVLVLAVA
jgi:hypothetical protein